MKLGFLKSKKFKQSTINIAFIAVVVLVVILFNTIFSILADKNNWYFDMTEEQVFTLSDNAKAVIENASRDVEIEIIFSSKKDLLENKRTTHQASMGFVVATAEQIASTFDNISVSYHDIARENTFFMELSKLAGPTVKLTESSVIVARKDKDGRYTQVRSYSTNNFFATDEYKQIHAYGGELTFASAILSLTAESQPTVYFTIGHEEVSFYEDLVMEDGKVLEKIEVNHSNSDVSQIASTGAYAEAVELMKVFTDAGYVVKPVDLKNGIPDDASIIVINAPATDFTTEELDYLTLYLLNEDEPGTLFCFLAKEREFYDENGNATQDKNVFDNFTRLNDFISARTGSKIVADNGYVQDENAKDNDSFFAVNGLFPDNNAISVYLPGRSDANVRFDESVYIEKTGNTTHWDEPNEDNHQTGGYIEGSFSSYTMPLVVSSNKATVEKNGALVKGQYNLMTMTAVNYWRQDTTDEITSYFLLSASNKVISPSNLQDGSYVNRDLMYSIIRTTGGSQTGVPVGLGYTNFFDYDLNISTKQANRATWCLALILPLAIVATGIVVIVKRKRR